jgi:hypothetical protein
MESDLIVTVNRSIEIFSGYRSRAGDGRNDTELIQSDSQTLLSLLRMAGISAGSLEAVKWKEAEECPERFPQEFAFPFLVRQETGGGVSKAATAWLDRAYKAVRKSSVDGVAAFQAVIDLIFRIIPLDPIRITKEGDLLVDKDGGMAVKEGDSGYVLEICCLRDHDPLPKKGKMVGTHYLCGGPLMVRESNPEQDALCCYGCFLRITIPKGLATYGDLRKAAGLDAFLYEAEPANTQVDEKESAPAETAA